jgi:hypothetical protein
MEHHKNYMNELEFRFGFSLDSLEHFWNIYRDRIDKPLSTERLKMAAAFQAHSPQLLTRD